MPFETFNVDGRSVNVNTDLLIDPAKPEAFSRGVGSGVGIVKSAAGESLAAAGSELNLPRLAKYGTDLAASARQDLAGKYRAPVGRIEDVESLSDFGSYAAFNIGTQIPILATLAAGGGAGALAARSLGAAPAVGRVAGFIAGDYPLQFDEGLQAFREQGLSEEEAREQAALGAIPRTAFDIAPTELLFRRFTRGGGAPGIRGRARSGAGGALSVGVAEAVTETAQEGVTVLQQKLLDPEFDITSPEVQSQFLNAAVAALITGGIFGGAAGFAGRRTPTQPVPLLPNEDAPVVDAGTREAPTDQLPLFPELSGGEVAGAPAGVARGIAPEQLEFGLDEQPIQGELDFAAPQPAAAVDESGQLPLDFNAILSPPETVIPPNLFLLNELGTEPRTVDDLISGRDIALAGDTSGRVFRVADEQTPGQITLVDPQTGQQFSVPESQLQNLRVDLNETEIKQRVSELEESFQPDDGGALNITLTTDDIEAAKAAALAAVPRGRPNFADLDSFVGKTLNELRGYFGPLNLGKSVVAALDHIEQRAVQRADTERTRIEQTRGLIQAREAAAFELAGELTTTPTGVIPIGLENNPNQLSLELLPQTSGTLTKADLKTVTNQISKMTSVKRLVGMFREIINDPTAYREDGLLKAAQARKLRKIYARVEKLAKKSRIALTGLTDRETVSTPLTQRQGQSQTAGLQLENELSSAEEALRRIGVDSQVVFEQLLRDEANYTGEGNTRELSLSTLTKIQTVLMGNSSFAESVEGKQPTSENLKGRSPKNRAKFKKQYRSLIEQWVLMLRENRLANIAFFERMSDEALTDVQAIVNDTEQWLEGDVTAPWAIARVSQLEVDMRNYRINRDEIDPSFDLEELQAGLQEFQTRAQAIWDEQSPGGTPLNRAQLKLPATSLDPTVLLATSIAGGETTINEAGELNAAGIEKMRELMTELQQRSFLAGKVELRPSVKAQIGQIERNPRAILRAPRMKAKGVTAIRAILDRSPVFKRRQSFRRTQQARGLLFSQSLGGAVTGEPLVLGVDPGIEYDKSGNIIGTAPLHTTKGYRAVYGNPLEQELRNVEEKFIDRETNQELTASTRNWLTERGKVKPGDTLHLILEATDEQLSQLMTMMTRVGDEQQYNLLPDTVKPAPTFAEAQGLVETARLEMRARVARPDIQSTSAQAANQYGMRDYIKLRKRFESRPTSPLFRDIISAPASVLEGYSRLVEAAKTDPQFSGDTRLRIQLGILADQARQELAARQAFPDLETQSAALRDKVLARVRRESTKKSAAEQRSDKLESFGRLASDVVATDKAYADTLSDDEIEAIAETDVVKAESLNADLVGGIETVSFEQLQDDEFTKADAIATALEAENQDSLSRIAEEVGTPESTLQHNIVKSAEIVEAIQRMLGFDRVVIQTPSKIAGNRAGSFDPVRSIIQVAMNAADPLSIAAHEAYHAARNSFLTKSEASRVAAAFKEGKQMRRLLEGVIREVEGENAQRVIDSLETPTEVEAYAYQYWSSGQLQTTGVLSRAFNAIKAFFERVGNFIAGQGFNNWEDVFDALYAGRLSNRNTVLNTTPELSGELTAANINTGVEPVSDFTYYSNSETNADVNEDLFDHGRAVADELPQSWLRRFLSGAPELAKEGNFKNYMKSAWFSALGSMQMLARVSVSARKAFTVIKEQIEERDTIISEANNAIIGVEDELNRNDKQSIERVYKVLRDGNDENKNWIDDTAELSRRGLKPSEIEAYQTIRAKLDELLVQREVAQARKLDDAGLDSDAVNAARATAQQLVDQGYIPKRRYGQYAVGFIDKETGQTLAYFHEESPALRQDVIKRFKAAFGDKIVISTETKNRQVLEQHGSELHNFLDRLRLYNIKIDPALRKKLILDMTNSINQLNKLKRRDVIGESKDTQRVLAEMIIASANQTSSANHSRRINDAVVNGQWEREGELGGYYKEKTTELVNYMRTSDIYEDGPGNLARKLRAGAAMAYLGGNISHGVIQLSQLPMATMPYLTNYLGYATAAGKTLTALKDAGSHPIALGDINKLRKMVTQKKGFGNITAEELAGMLEAAEEGIIQAQQIYAISGIARNKLLSRSSALRKYSELWLTPFTMSEELNRRATFLAAFRIGKQLEADGQPLNIVTARESISGEQETAASVLDFAKRAVEETQFIYNQANRPRWARSEVGAILYTFKSYPIFMTELLLSLPKKGQLTMLGTLFMASGMSGLFYLEDLEDLIETLTQATGSSMPDVRRALKRNLEVLGDSMGFGDLGDFMIDGPLNYSLSKLAPGAAIDIGERLGLGNIVPGTGIFKRTGDVTQEIADVFGPVGSLVSGLATATGRGLRGDIRGAFQKLPISGIRNAIQGGYYLADDYTARDVRGYKLDEVSGLQAITKMIGFSPLQISRAFEVDRTISKYKSYVGKIKKDFITEIVRASSANDTKAKREALRAVNEWNRSHPEPALRITIRRQDLKRTLQRAEQNIVQRRLSSLPRKQRAGFEFEFADELKD